MNNDQTSGRILGFAEKIVRKEVEANEKQWPPFCSGIFHQLKRPKAK